MTKPIISVERLRELLDYDPDTGVFTRKLSTSRAGKAGSIAGCLKPDGYVHIKISGKSYGAHRLVWLWVYGKWPYAEIDHINRIRNDNRLCNLREASPSENQQNHRKENRSSRSRLLGAHWNKAGNKYKWRAQIVVKGQKFHLGLFETAEAAHEAYLTAKRTHHPHGMI